DTVVVAGDRASADIRARADGRVAKIAQMPGFRAFMDHGFLNFDEVSDVDACTDVGSGTQAREWTDVGGGADARIDRVGVRADEGAVVNARIVQHAASANLAVRADARGS